MLVLDGLRRKSGGGGCGGVGGGGDGCDTRGGRQTDSDKNVHGDKSRTDVGVYILAGGLFTVQCDR